MADVDVEFQLQASENEILKLDASSKDLGEFVQNVAKNLWGSPKFSDTIVKLNGVAYACHKALLSSASPLLSSQLQQAKDGKIITIDVAKNESELFLMMLQYIYKGSIDAITMDQIIPLLSLAHKYGIKSLKEQCGDILAQNVSADNAFQFLNIAKEFGGVETLQTACAHYISQNFRELVNDKIQVLLKLDTYTFKKMIDSSDLSVKSERDVFEVVLRYATQFEGQKRTDVLNELLPSVRYNLLPMKYLVETVELHPQLKDLPILKKLTYEAYRHRVVPTFVPSFVTKHRKTMVVQSEFSVKMKGPNIVVTDDHRTASNTTSSYNVIHSEFFESGLYVFRLKVTNSTYVGIGVVDETLTNYQQEFHNTAGCYVYYMSGPAYSNGSNDGSIEGFTHGDIVTLILNMEEKSFMLVKKGRIMKKVNGIKGKKALGVLISNGAVTLLGDDEPGDDNWESVIAMI